MIVTERGGPDMNEQILEVARAVRDKYPKGENKGKCIQASDEICGTLYGLGFHHCSIQFGHFNGQPHSWVEAVVDGCTMLLDVTADQFGDYPAVWWTRMNGDRVEYVYD